MSDDLEVLDPQPTVVMFRGERLEIRPLTIGKLPAFSRLVRPVVVDFFSGLHPEWLTSDDAMLADVMELHGEAIVAALAIAADKPAAFIAEHSDASELLALARTVVEQNTPFFTRVIRAVRAAQDHAQSLPRNGIGSMQSSDLSEPAIH